MRTPTRGRDKKVQNPGRGPGWSGRADAVGDESDASETDFDADRAGSDRPTGLLA
ncbi:hypothetical protein [Haloarchaeobius sp. DT45]|uniref:hypothetical protein n=1 Tax=Haloarchaeobius sp. DT45 TaxID=3446116 RepID=UPI003F6BF9B0